MRPRRARRRRGWVGLRDRSACQALDAAPTLTFVYENVLSADDIRRALALVREREGRVGTAQLRAWLAAHPNAPEDVLRELAGGEDREVLLSLALNPSLPADLRRWLLNHPDDDIRVQANHVTARLQVH